MRLRLNSILLCCAGLTTVAVGAACSSSKSSGSSGSVTGTLLGAAMDVKSTISGTISLGGTNQSFGLVIMSDAPDLCAAATAGFQPKNSKVLFLAFGDLNPGTGVVTPPTAAGNYSVFDGVGSPTGTKIVLAEYAMLDSSCNTPSGSGFFGTGGTIALTAATAAYHYAGHGTMLAGTAANVTLKFDSEDCPALSAALASTAGLACQ